MFCFDFISRPFCFLLLVDFGLHEFRREDTDPDPDVSEERKRKELSGRVYQAPETRSTSGVAISASDVYSFAIILVEVANRDDAYEVYTVAQSLFSCLQKGNLSLSVCCIVVLIYVCSIARTGC